MFSGQLLCLFKMLFMFLCLKYGDHPLQQVQRFSVKSGKCVMEVPVVLKLLLVTAYPDLSANEATMINMCTNRTVNESRVYLTLRNTLHVPEKQSMCRCTIRPTVSVKLLALDVRLQTATNHSCGSTSIKV